ncbi:unnamed protein product [Alternaria sp. RS040]
MEYLDNLDQHAMCAFDELDRDTVLPDRTSAPKLSSELRDLLRSNKQRRTLVKGVADRKSSNMHYPFKLSDPVTPTILALAAILPSQPRIIQGEGEDGIAQFCHASDLDIPKIKGWLAKAYPDISPTFAPISMRQRSMK